MPKTIARIKIIGGHFFLRFMYISHEQEIAIYSTCAKGIIALRFFVFIGYALKPVVRLNFMLEILRDYRRSTNSAVFRANYSKNGNKLGPYNLDSYKFNFL